MVGARMTRTDLWRLAGCLLMTLSASVVVGGVLLVAWAVLPWVLS